MTATELAWKRRALAAQDCIGQMIEDFDRLAREKRKAYEETGHQKWLGMDIAYTQAKLKAHTFNSNLTSGIYD